MAVKIDPESQAALDAFMTVFSQMPTDQLVKFVGALGIIGETLDAMPKITEPTAVEFIKHLRMFTSNMYTMAALAGVDRLQVNTQPKTDSSRLQ